MNPSQRPNAPAPAGAFFLPPKPQEAMRTIFPMVSRESGKRRRSLRIANGLATTLPTLGANPLGFRVSPLRLSPQTLPTRAPSPPSRNEKQIAVRKWCPEWYENAGAYAWG